MYYTYIHYTVGVYKTHIQLSYTSVLLSSAGTPWYMHIYYTVNTVQHCSWVVYRSPWRAVHPNSSPAPRSRLHLLGSNPLHCSSLIGKVMVHWDHQSIINGTLWAPLNPYNQTLIVKVWFTAMTFLTKEWRSALALLSRPRLKRPSLVLKSDFALCESDSKTEWFFRLSEWAKEQDCSRAYRRGQRVSRLVPFLDSNLRGNLKP